MKSKNFEDMSIYTRNIESLEKAKLAFDENKISFDENEYNTALNKLKNQRIDANKALIKKQENCNHNWQYEWYDSHYDYYVCSKCGKKKRV